MGDWAWTRVVTAGRSGRQPLVPAAAFTLLCVATLAAAPWALDHVDETRRFLDPGAKRLALLVCGGAVCVAAVASFLVLLTGLGVLGVLYGRKSDRGAGVTLASPLGVLGVPGRRIRLAPGPAAIRVVVLPKRAAYAYGSTQVWVQQDERRMSVASIVALADGSRDRLLAWLAEQGVSATVEGDVEALR